MTASAALNASWRRTRSDALPKQVKLTAIHNLNIDDKHPARRCFTTGRQADGLYGVHANARWHEARNGEKTFYALRSILSLSLLFSRKVLKANPLKFSSKLTAIIFTHSA